MDIWLYYDVTHILHTYCNPISGQTLREVEELLELTPDQRVLDIACGKGEMLVGLAERYGVSGVGVDISPYAVERARQRVISRVPDADIQLVQMPGQEYRTETRFDVTFCVGASWIWNGFVGTLEAMRGFTREGGLLVCGEPYWRQAPPAEYLEAAELKADQFGTLAECGDTARNLGFSVVTMRASSQEDWDRYEMLQTASLDRFAREQPDHPDLPAIREKLLPDKEAYLKQGRECLGFALWVLR